VKGLSEDGGFEEFREFLPSRASSSATRAVRDSICAVNAAISGSWPHENSCSDT
jgi:hypothetical protein